MAYRNFHPHSFPRGRDWVNMAEVPESRHAIFVRGLSPRNSEEEIEEFFAEYAGPCTIDFNQISLDGTLRFVAVRFESRKDASYAYRKFGEEGLDILGYQCQVTWFKDRRRYLRLNTGGSDVFRRHRNDQDRKKSDSHDETPRKERRARGSADRSRNSRSRSRDSRALSKSKSPSPKKEKEKSKRDATATMSDGEVEDDSASQKDRRETSVPRAYRGHSPVVPPRERERDALRKYFPDDSDSDAGEPADVRSSSKKRDCKESGNPENGEEKVKRARSSVSSVSTAAADVPASNTKETKAKEVVDLDHCGSGDLNASSCGKSSGALDHIAFKMDLVTDSCPKKVVKKVPVPSHQSGDFESSKKDLKYQDIEVIEKDPGQKLKTPVNNVVERVKILKSCLLGSVKNVELPRAPLSSLSTGIPARTDELGSKWRELGDAAKELFDFRINVLEKQFKMDAETYSQVLRGVLEFHPHLESEMRETFVGLVDRLEVNLIGQLDRFLDQIS